MSNRGKSKRRCGHQRTDRCRARQGRQKHDNLLKRGWRKKVGTAILLELLTKTKTDRVEAVTMFFTNGDRAIDIDEAERALPRNTDTR